MKVVKTFGALLLACLCVPELVARPPSDAEPVYCQGIAATGSGQILDCRFARDDTNATPVPIDRKLYVTNISVNPNSIASSGTFRVLLGREDGDPFPGRPNLRLLGTPVQMFNNSTPHIVLSSGDDLAIYNDSSSDFPVDVYVSGYIAETFSAPREDLIFKDRFEM